MAIALVRDSPLNTAQQSARFGSGQVTDLIINSPHMRSRINKPPHSGPSADSIDHSQYSGQLDFILPEFEFLEDRG